MNSVPQYIRDAAAKKNGAQVEVNRYVGKDTNGNDVYQKVFLSAKAVLKVLSKDYKDRSPLGKRIRPIDQVDPAQQITVKPDVSLLSDEALKIELEKRGMKVEVPVTQAEAIEAAKKNVSDEIQPEAKKPGRPKKEESAKTEPESILEDDSLKTS